MCFVYAHHNGIIGGMSAGRAWTICTIDDDYLPDVNIDLYGSSSNNANMKFALWDDGQIVAKALDKQTPEGTSFSFSGFWRY